MASGGDRPSRQRAFTLLELMLVMILLGVIAGIGVAGFDRIDPGYRAFTSSLSSFLETSRDRARATGYEVVVSLQEASADRPARLQRASFRPVLEASFEAAFREREGILIRGDASLEESGSAGAGLDLEPGGEAEFSGRGQPDLSAGFALSCDFRDRGLHSGDILHWEGFLDLRLRRDGVMEIVLQAGDGDYFQDVRLELPAAAVRRGRWQHLRLTAVDGELWAEIDGQEVARMSIPPQLGQPRSAIRLGGMEGGWSGQLDELQVLARLIENGPSFPDDLQLESQLPLRFDRRGTLILPTPDSPGIPLILRVFDDVVGQFMVGRFTQEVLP